ncbi:transglycosylase SLT domain-containing protein [uncultured Photobacterium sp.]|uniref:transglycosylase SLT domain-containing protein n=1 Tax=uncultured Photobacterium sp. TaxID=173973 RepID=UPI0026122D07|nr:transglycosylase SLT domain-containing protein [uncultured Photobacterium sp.]
MKLPLIFLTPFLISGCQGMNQVIQPPTVESELLISINNFPDNIINQCSINTKMQEGSYIATGVPYETTEIETLTPKQNNEPDLWDILGHSFTFKVPNNKHVRYYKNWYLNNQYHLDTVTERAKPFLFYIYEQVKDRNMPTEIALLPFVESSFDQFAYSHRGAAGLWQITKPTGKTFGLDYLAGYDGRRDIITSTNAALDLLEYLFDRFDGNWLHAIAAYNTGEARVRNAIKQNKANGRPTHFWALQLPKETRLYVPKLLAIVNLIKHQDRHTLKLVTIQPEPVVTEVVINERVKLNLIAQHAGINHDKLLALNPGYTNGYTFANRDNKILLPNNTKETFFKNKESNEYIKQKFTIHHIKAGESLSELAQLNNTSVSMIKSINDLSNSVIFAGQELIIPRH